MLKKILSLMLSIVLILSFSSWFAPKEVCAEGSPYVWNFVANGDSQGWTLANSLSGSVSGGNYDLTITGSDPYMLSPDNLGMDASSNKILRIRMKNHTSNTTAAIYWTTNADISWSSSKAQGFTINATDGNYTEYTVDLSKNQYWTGTIKRIRIDLVNGSATSGTVNIDYILIDTGFITWNFDTNGDSQSWALPHSLSGSVFWGSYSLTITGSDPYMFSPNNLGMDASAFKILKIRMKNNTPGITAKIYWTTTADGSWDASKAQGFDIIANDSKYTEYTVDLSGNPYWTGTIKQIRIDPVNDNTITSGTVNIDYVTASALRNVWDYNIDDDGEGWDLFRSLSGTVSGGNYDLTITGSDPYMLSPDHLGMDAFKYKFLKIRMKNNTPDTTAAIHWTTTADSSWGTSKTQEFTINATDEKYTEYIVDLSKNQYWTGTIKQIRIDPVHNSTSGTVSIDNISMLTLRPVNVTQVGLDYTSFILNTGSTQALTATVLPGNADNKAVTWSSSNPSVAVVDSNGMVTGIAAGTAVITATSADGSKTSSCMVQVLDLLHSWGFDHDGNGEGWDLFHSLSGSVSGESYNLTITGSDPYMLSPDNIGMDASRYKYLKIRMKNNTPDTTAAIYWTTTEDSSWSASKVKGFTIHANDGNYTEYIVDLSGHQYWTGTIKRIRIDPINSSTITSGTVDIDYVLIDIAAIIWNFNSDGDSQGWNLFHSLSGTVSGGNYDLTITGSDPYMLSQNNLGIDASKDKILKIRMKNNTPDTTAAIYWTTTADTSWNVSKAKGFFIKTNDENYTEYTLDLSGNQYWTGTIQQLRFDPINGSTISGTVSIDYIALITLQPVSGVTLNYSSINVNPGSTQALTATVLPSNAGNKAVTWSSSNVNVAAVDANGIITGYSAGTAVITATTVDGGMTASCTVEVPVVLQAVRIGSNKTVLMLGDSLPLTVTGTLSDSTQADLSQAQIAYTSDNTQVATVDGTGLLMAVANGTANITATVTLNGVNKANTVPIVVNSGACFQITTVDNQNISTSTDFTVQGTATGVTKPMWYEVYSNNMSGNLVDFGAFAAASDWWFVARHLSTGVNVIKVYAVNSDGNTESITITVNLVVSSSPVVRPRPNPAEIWWGGLGQNQQLMDKPDEWTFVKKYADAYFFHTYYWANGQQDTLMSSMVSQLQPYGTKYAAELAGDTIYFTPDNPDAWPNYQNTNPANGGTGANGWISNAYNNTGMVLTEATHDFHPDLNIFAYNYPSYTQSQLLAKLQQLWNSYFTLNYQYAPHLKHSDTWQPSWWWWQMYPPLGGEKRNSDKGVKFNLNGKLYNFDGFYIIDALRNAALSIQGHPYWSFFADAPYYVLTWNEGNNEGADLRVKMRAMEQWMHNLGSKFTLTCNEDPGVALANSDPSSWDQKFAENSLKSIQLYQSEGGRADRYNFESWYVNSLSVPIPFTVTSEDTEYSYTWLVKQAIKYLKGIKDTSGTLEQLTLTQSDQGGRKYIQLTNNGDVKCMPTLVAFENGDSSIIATWYDNNDNVITDVIKSDEGWTYTAMLDPGQSISISCAVSNPGGTSGKTFSVEAFWNPQDPTGIVRDRSSWTVN